MTISAEPVRKRNICELSEFVIMFLEKQSTQMWGFPGGSGAKNPSASAGDMGLIPGSGRFTGEGNGNPLKYSCLETPMDRRVYQAMGSQNSWT